MRREPIGVLLFVFVLILLIYLEGMKMQEKMPELVRGAKYPSLDRNPVPDVNHDCWTAIFLRHRQSEETFGFERQPIHLDASGFEQAANIADRFALFIANELAARFLSSVHRALAAVS